MRMQGKVALITGGGRGLGKAICLTLAREGADISIGDMDAAEAEAVAGLIRRTGRRALAVKVDVSRAEEVKTLVARTIATFGTIDVLVNNAGIFDKGPVAEMTEASWDKVLDVNLKGTFLCSREVLPVLKQNRSGKIVSIASLAGQAGGLLAGSNYAASKAGVICLTKSLAKELGPFGINVNCIAPGIIATEMTRAFPREDLKKTIPLRAIGEPQDVADAVLFLASEESKYITGETLNVNGGILMN